MSVRRGLGLGLGLGVGLAVGPGPDTVEDGGLAEWAEVRVGVFVEYGVNVLEGGGTVVGTVEGGERVLVDWAGRWERVVVVVVV